VLVFALCLGADILPRTTGSISVVIAFAGLLWIGAAFIFLRLDEPEADPDPDSDFQLQELVKPLQQDDEFRTYIGTRALMISTALAPPFLVMLGGQSSETGVANLGMLMLASSIAAITSSYIWGRFSDRSSRKTLMTSGALCAAVLGLAAALGGLGDNPISSWVLASLLFLAQLAYQGARAGRKTHLTDMDTHGHTSLYTALSNSMIGVLLLCGGAFGWLADAFGPALVLAVLAAMAGAGAALGARLSEVQDDRS
jgi:predicted MFS family arabinose efflux permease